MAEQAQTRAGLEAPSRNGVEPLNLWQRARLQQGTFTEARTLELLLALDDAGLIDCLLPLVANPEHGPLLLYQAPVLARLAAIRQTQAPLYLGVLLPGLRRLGLYVLDLERKLDTLPPASSPRLLAPYAPPLAPPLPTRAALDPRLREGAAPFLDAYAAYSVRWSPRAAAGFHMGVGVWVMATVCASRICVEMGSPIYPNLFLALVAPSTMYAKTTTAKLGLHNLTRAGCAALLAPDRATPQALLRVMAGQLPPDFADLDAVTQEDVRHRLVFAGQRGWYYEEWGGMLQQMTRRDSPMADFHGLLRALDDGFESFSSETIHRGMERIDHPAMAFLGSATPHDLARYMAPGSAWWHDGFWPRMALLVPLADELPSLRRREAGAAALPNPMVQALQLWHQRLGIPTVHLTPRVAAGGKPTGKYQLEREPHPRHILALSTAVLEAYYTYNGALLDLIIAGDAPPDLNACYGRYHDKALRIAMLLASFAGQDTIEMPQWAYAQDLTEQWRLMLHQAVALADSGLPLTRDEQLEAKVTSQLGRHGPMTLRELTHNIRGFSSREITAVVQAFLRTGSIETRATAQTIYYALPTDMAPARGADEQTGEVPF